MRFLRALQTIAEGLLAVVKEMIATLGTVGSSVSGFLSTMYSALEAAVRFPIRFIKAPDKGEFLREAKRRFLLNFTLLRRKFLWFVRAYPHKALFRSAFALWLVAVVVLGQASMEWSHVEEEKSYQPRSVARSVQQERGVAVQTKPVVKDTTTGGATGVTSRAVLPSSRDTIAKQYVYAGNTDSTTGETTTSGDTNGNVLGENTTPTPTPTLAPGQPTSTPVPGSPTSTPAPGSPTSTPVPSVPTSTPQPQIPTSTPVPSSPTPTPDPGVLAINVPSGYKVVLASDNTTDVSKVGQRGPVDVLVYKGGVLLAEIPVNFDASPDFDGFYGGANASERKSFISVPATLSQVGPYHTLFIPKFLKDNKATICPEAFSYDDIYQFCPNRINVSDGYVNGAVAAYDLGNYWRIEGMTGTGGSSTYVNQVKDVMTRQQVTTLSSHTISFVLSASETFTAGEWVTVDFHEDDSGFTVDGASFTASDVTFNDGTTRTIVDIGSSPSCGAGANDMTVQIDDTAGTLKFLACGSYTPSSTAATITINIGASAGGTDRVTNPSTVGSQSIDFPNDFGDADFGIAVPIMDSDQVSISASVDTYISFDIDTSEGHGDNDASDGEPGTYELDLGELTYNSVTTESAIKEIYIDIDTNADDGAIIQVASGFGASGLYSNSSGDSIPSVSGTLTASSLNGGYGLAAKTLNTQDEGTLVPISPYDVFGAANDVGQLLTTFQTIFNTGGTPGAPIVNGSGEIAVRAVAGTSTSAADDYTDTLTFRAVAVY